jgi:hypothetical protein
MVVKNVELALLRIYEFVWKDNQTRPDCLNFEKPLYRSVMLDYTVSNSSFV